MNRVASFVGYVVLLGAGLYLMFFLGMLLIMVMMPVLMMFQLFGAIGLMAVVMGFCGYKLFRHFLD